MLRKSISKLNKDFQLLNFVQKFIGGLLGFTVLNQRAAVTTTTTIAKFYFIRISFKKPINYFLPIPLVYNALRKNEAGVNEILTINLQTVSGIKISTPKFCSKVDWVYWFVYTRLISCCCYYHYATVYCAIAKFLISFGFGFVPYGFILETHLFPIPLVHTTLLLLLSSLTVLAYLLLLEKENPLISKQLKLLLYYGQLRRSLNYLTYFYLDLFPMVSFKKLASRILNCNLRINVTVVY